MSGKLRILVVGQTPPPYHGQAIMIERLLRGNFARVQLYHVRMAFSNSNDEVGRFRFTKVLHLVSVILRIVWCRLAHGTRVLYYPPAGPNRAPAYRDIIILLCTRWMFRRTILHFHAGGISQLYPTVSEPLQWLFRKALFHADSGVRVSRGSPDDARLLECRREFVVPNGIDDEAQRFEFERRKRIEARRGKPSLVAVMACDNSLTSTDSSGAAVFDDATPLRILFAGILRESKGFLVLLEACRLLTARGVPFELEVMGEFQSAEFEQRAHSKIEELGIGSQVKLLGLLSGDEKWAAYARADVFCLPTFYEAETFAIVLVEAMSFGLPVVATRWRGIPEVVEDGATGFLVDIHDAQAVAERLEQLHADPDLADRFAAAGREKFLREFTAARFWRQMENVFLETAAS